MPAPDFDPGLHALVYVSSAARDLSDADLDAIVAGARRANEARGITGVLLYCDGNFMQYIEGAPQDVRETFARICASGRHHGVSELMSEPIARREFPSWPLGFSSIAGFDFFDLACADREAGARPGPGRELLGNFWRSCRSARPGGR